MLGFLEGGDVGKDSMLTVNHTFLPPQYLLFRGGGRAQPTLPPSSGSYSIVIVIETGRLDADQSKQKLEKPYQLNVRAAIY